MDDKYQSDGFPTLVYYTAILLITALIKDFCFCCYKLISKLLVMAVLIIRVTMLELIISEMLVLGLHIPKVFFVPEVFF